MVEKIVRTEVIYNVDCMVRKLLNDGHYEEELSKISGALEYWLVDSRLAKELKAHGELVANFYDLDIWGRATSGQSIELDTVIEDIAIEHLERIDGIMNKQ
jgi:hypothetical protein